MSHIDVVIFRIDAVISHIDAVIFHMDTVISLSASQSILSSCHLVDRMTRSYLVTLGLTVSKPMLEARRRLVSAPVTRIS